MNCDFWSHKRLFLYICRTGHYIMLNFDCVSTFIDFSCFLLRHNATNISKSVQESLRALNVYEKTIRIHCMCSRKQLLITAVCVLFTGIPHRLHLTVCNSVGFWLRKPNRSSSSSPWITSIPEPDSDCTDGGDLADADRLSPASLANQYSARHDDYDHSTATENTTENEVEDFSVNIVDNWSLDVLVDFDSSTYEEGQTSIGTMMTKFFTSPH